MPALKPAAAPLALTLSGSGMGPEGQHLITGLFLQVTIFVRNSVQEQLAAAQAALGAAKQEAEDSQHGQNTASLRAKTLQTQLSTAHKAAKEQAEVAKCEMDRLQERVHMVESNLREERERAAQKVRLQSDSSIANALEGTKSRVVMHTIITIIVKNSAQGLAYTALE